MRSGADLFTPASSNDACPSGLYSRSQHTKTCRTARHVRCGWADDGKSAAEEQARVCLNWALGCTHSIYLHLCLIVRRLRVKKASLPISLLLSHRLFCRKSSLLQTLPSALVGEGPSPNDRQQTHTRNHGFYYVSMRDTGRAVWPGNWPISGERARYGYRAERQNRAA